MTTFNWNATSFFKNLVDRNRLAIKENFTFCRVSGLEGFEEALHNLQSATAIVAVSDTSQGYMEMNNTPRTRRVKTVFLAMRHALDDMTARQECFDTLRELFRQFMSQLILEKVKLEQNRIYLDPQISFNEIERYFFSGAACAYFQIAVDTFTDLRYNESEWSVFGNLWLIEIGPNKVKLLKLVRSLTGLSLGDAKDLVESAPCKILDNLSEEQQKSIIPQFEELDAVIEIRPI